MERKSVVGQGVVAMVVAGVATLASVRPTLAILHGAAAPGSPTWSAADVARDLGLLVLFGLQHSLQARSAWKCWHRARFDRRLERITYVMFSCLAWAFAVSAWRSIPGTVWRLEGAAAVALQAAGVAGWVLAAGSVLVMSAGDISGISSLRAILAGRPFAPPRFRAPGPYRLVRHPIMLGLIVAFWAAPVVSADRALLAAGLTLYVLVGVVLEERDLEAELGPVYDRYRRAVPMLVPVPGRALWREGEET